MSTGWDNATLKKLKALTGKGLSTAEIGKRLGMSKNAIVGKLNRLGWNQSADTAKSETRSAFAKASADKNAKREIKKTTSVKKVITVKPKPSKVTAKTVKPAPRATLSKSPKNLAMHQRIIQHSLGLANLKPGQCRWPQGNPDSEDFHFCGAPVFAGKPYCYEHCKQAYQFNPPKKK